MASIPTTARGLPCLVQKYIHPTRPFPMSFRLLRRRKAQSCRNHRLFCQPNRPRASFHPTLSQPLPRFQGHYSKSNPNSPSNSKFAHAKSFMPLAPAKKKCTRADYPPKPQPLSGLARGRTELNASALGSRAEALSRTLLSLSLGTLGAWPHVERTAAPTAHRLLLALDWGCLGELRGESCGTGGGGGRGGGKLGSSGSVGDLLAELHWGGRVVFGLDGILNVSGRLLVICGNRDLLLLGREEQTARLDLGAGMWPLKVGLKPSFVVELAMVVRVTGRRKLAELLLAAAGSVLVSCFHKVGRSAKRGVTYKTITMPSVLRTASSIATCPSPGIATVWRLGLRRGASAV